MKKIAVLACALVMAVGLFACSGGSSEGGTSEGQGAPAPAAPSANLQDYGWIAFEMPEGWEDANESDKYETIAEADDSHHIMKFMVNSLTKSYPTAADKAAHDIETSTTGYTEGGTATIGNYEWTLVNFTFNDTPSFMAYADIADERCLKITVYEMSIDDPAVQTVFNTLSINQDELW